MSIALTRGNTFVALLIAFLILAGGGSQATAVEFRVNTFTTNDQDAPAVAPVAGGGFIAVWASQLQDGSGAGIRAQRYAASGAKVGGEFPVNTSTLGDQDSPSVAVLSGGGFVIVWESAHQPGFGKEIYAQRYNASGAKIGGEFRVNTYRTLDQETPVAAALANNAFVIVWASENQDAGTSDGIYAQRYANGARAGVEFPVNTVKPGRQQQPAVSLYGTNSFIIAWTGQDGTGSGVFAQRYTAAGVKVGGEFRVNASTIGTQNRPAIARLKNGTVVIVFASEAGSAEVLAQRYTATGVPTGSQFRVNSFITNDQSFPAVSGTPGGGFTVAWASYLQDGSGYGVYAQRFTAAGARVLTEFPVNEVTPNDQENPAVAPWSTNGFVIIWERQDLSGIGVFGKRYAN